MAEGAARSSSRLREPPGPGAFEHDNLLSDHERELWLAFLRVHTSLIRRLDDELEAAYGISLNMLEVLYHLAVVPGNRLRMAELAERLLFTRSGVTRLVDRLERRGLVLRRGVDHDLRGRYATLTQRGFKLFEEAAAGHVVTLRRLFFGVLSEEDKADLSVILSRLEQEPVPGA
jgi:DNA-binding MarR family transcriptional regulator